MPLNTIVRGAVARVTRSRRLAQVLFGIKLRPLKQDEYYFDVTTPVLVFKAGGYVNARSRVLDLGVGSFAIVGLSLWKKFGCQVTGVDVNPELVALSRENIEHNDAPIPVVCSSFFEGVEQDFDVVIFNPPYVPSETGESRKLPSRFRSQWDGGPEGTSIIRQFLNACAEDRRTPKVLMGVNRKHVSRERLKPLFQGFPSLQILETYSSPWLPVDVYVFQRRHEARS